jgi:hypothetical protein
MQWLTGRRQRVVLNGKNLNGTEVLLGVLQGSVLVLILVLRFINYMDGAVRKIEILKKFADDTKMGQTAASKEDVENIQDTINKLVEWVDKLGMEFNIFKCKVM